jgi:flagellar biosynthesis protein
MANKRKAPLSESQKRRKLEIAKKIKKSISDLDLPRKVSDRSAIALRYDIEKDAAPLILAAGKGQMAQEILKLAEDNQIPLFEDKQLANMLIKLESSSEIPPELFTLVAEVLAFVFRLDQMSAKRKEFEKRAKDLIKPQ